MPHTPSPEEEREEILELLRVYADRIQAGRAARPHRDRLLKRGIELEMEAVDLQRAAGVSKQSFHKIIHE